VFIPLTVGAECARVRDVRRLLNAGPTRSQSTPPRVQNPQLIADAAGRYGAQCIVVAIDAKQTRAAAGSRDSLGRCYSWGTPAGRIGTRSMGA